MYRLLAVLIALIAWPAAADLYVSADGDDADPGTLAEPKQTIKTTLAAASASETVWLLDTGGDFTSSNQGGDANMKGWQFPADGVSLSAYTGDSPVVDFTGISFIGGDRLLNGYNGQSNNSFVGITFANCTLATYFILWQGANTDGHTIQDCVFDDIDTPTGSGILHFRYVSSDPVRNVTIDGNTFKNMPADNDYAINYTGDNTETLEYLTISGNTFNQQSDLSDTLGVAAGMSIVDADSLIISNNVAWNCGNDQPEDGNGDDFIRLLGCDRVMVSGNTFTRYLRGASQASTMNDTDFLIATSSGSDGTADTIRASSNVVLGAGHAFQFNNSATVVVTNCVADSTIDDGFFFDDGVNGATITGCVSHYSQNNALDIQADNVTVRNCTFVRSNDEPINITATASSVDVSNTLVYDVREASDVVQIASGAASVTFDYNLYFDPDGAVAFDDEGTSRTFATWQSTGGYDANGVGNLDPAFKRPDGRATSWPPRAFLLRAGSPARYAASDGFHIGAVQDPDVVALGSFRDRGRGRGR